MAKLKDKGKSASVSITNLATSRIWHALGDVNLGGAVREAKKSLAHLKRWAKSYHYPVTSSEGQSVVVVFALVLAPTPTLVMVVIFIAVVADPNSWPQEFD